MQPHFRKKKQKKLTASTIIFFWCLLIVVTAFNEGEKTTDETLQQVGKIVKDRALNQRFQDLIHQAIAEKESQLEDEMGNGTFEGDVTLEIDQSLLMDDEEEVKAHDHDQRDDELQDTSAVVQEDEEDDLQAEQYPYDVDDPLFRDPSFNDTTSLTAPLRDDEDVDVDESESRSVVHTHQPRKQTI